MRRICFVLAVMLLIFGLYGCQQFSGQSLETEDEVSEGEFVYRLSTEKAVYEKNESIAIHAELEYTGDHEEIEITHAASPFSFPIIETTRNYDIEYFMEEPLVTTILIKGEPLRTEYHGGAGSYSLKDEEEYIEFIEQVTNQGYPVGHYIVNGIADFDVLTNGESVDYNMKAQVEFEVDDDR